MLSFNPFLSALCTKKVPEPHRITVHCSGTMLSRFHLDLLAPHDVNLTLPAASRLGENSWG